MERARNILALDAAFGQASACLLGADGRRHHASGEESLPHSQGILPLLEGLLSEAGMSWTDLDMLALGIGPGSFTGLRVAAASLAGINATLQLPVIRMSSLAVTALQTDANELWVLEDARSGDVYAGHYRTGKALQPDNCLSWDRVNGLHVTCYATQSPDMTSTRVSSDSRRIPLTRSRPEALGQLATLLLKDPDTDHAACRYPVPAYIRPSQAERNATPTT